MADITKYRRLFDLHRRFMSHARLTVSRMMDDYGVNRRTVNRDLNDLRRLGVKLEYDLLPDGIKVWQLPVTSRTISVPFNLTDLAALFMGRHLFDFAKGTLLEESLNKIYETIETQITRKKEFLQLSQLEKKLHIIGEGPKRFEQRHVEELDEVLTALFNDKLIEFEYQNATGELRFFSVVPYTLVAYRRGLYLLGKPTGETPRIFAVERLKNAVAIRGSRACIPGDYDPDAYFENALFMQRGTPVEVELLFAKNAASYIAIRQFHPSQTLTHLENGQVRMTLTVPAGEDDYEIVNWILSFHEYVEVKRPQSLRQKVIRQLHRTLAHYKSPSES